MGMYTVMCLNCNLKAETPTEVLDLLRYMMGESKVEPEQIPDHPLFNCDMQRWKYLLSSGICYADGPSYHILEQEKYWKEWEFAVHTSIKNYSYEFEHFLSWIAPYVETEGFIGYTRYEECDEPTLIFVYDGKAMSTVEGE